MEVNKYVLDTHTKYALNANTLKLIAALAMFFDHFAAVFFPHDTLWGVLLRIPGRISAPIMCCMIAEGYHHTSNLKRYITRLLICAVISHIPYNLCFNYSFFQATSVVWGLALGLIALAIVKHEDWNILLRIFGLGVCCLLSITANWNYIAVLWIVAFGVFYGNFRGQMISFSVIGIFLLILPSVTNLGFIDYSSPGWNWYQLGIFLAIPFLILYNGKRGKKSKFMTRFFYVFYPLHLLFIYVLRLCADSLIG